MGLIWFESGFKFQIGFRKFHSRLNFTYVRPKTALNVNRICAVIGKIQLRDVSGFCSENWRHSEINFILIYCTDKNIKKNFNRHVLRAVDENEGSYRV